MDVTRGRRRIMGYMLHHAIIMTSSIAGDGFDKIIDTFGSRGVFVRAMGIINKEETLVLIPDGSKEGWDVSQEGDQLRDDLIGFLKGMRRGGIYMT